ncbi:hypothetical protein MPSEU_000654300 [Mayamaea pseudoterrestris]|nr:hypothetical protein MPSEU_000654300 [Mayamaea pseudoterrestris]
MAKPNTKGRRGSSKQVSEAEIKKEAVDMKEETSEEDDVWDLKRILLGNNHDGCFVATCRTADCSGKAIAIWTSSADPSDEWPLCEQCQDDEFGGWPEGMEPAGNNDELVDSPLKPVVLEKTEQQPTTEPNDMTTDDNEEADEIWDLKKILSIAEISQECPIKCSHDNCPLPAGVAWVSNQNPTTKWYSCLDHQVADFGGWPDLHELPLKHMTKEHLQTLVDKCSSTLDIGMPIFPSLMSPCAATNAIDVSNTVTPGPRAQVGFDATATDLDSSTITPSPGLADAKKAAAKAPVSKKQLDMHRQWQATAESLGGPNARIIVNKNDAKKLIFDVLHDAFAPMNITDLHKALKGVVPSPVLKQSLNDMTLEKLGEENLFAESDDEDDEPKKNKIASPTKSDVASNDPYAKSLSVKAAKTANATLYFVDHNKLTNNGNGLDPEARNQLLSEHAKTKAELGFLNDSIKTMLAQASTLVTEPTNEEATTRLELEEAALDDLKKKLEAARGLQANEKHKLQIKRRIEHMASFWRKRKRLTMEFLIGLEENTDGVISAKKCLVGDGQIDLESDELAIKNSTAYYKSMKNRPSTKHGIANKKAKTSEFSSSLKATATFVGVKLDTIGCVERVHVEEEASD